MGLEQDLRPKITVIGVGGAGGNAVNNMIRAKLEGVEFIVANTDAQALAQSLVNQDRRVHLGLHVTQGLGAGSKPDVGRSAAEESVEEVTRHLQGSNMVFITAGMGGGTGTGAGPVIARAAREAGILTVGVVTKPFHFEGTHRTRTADRGIDELQQYVDTLIIIPNQNLFRIANEKTTFADAFKMADDVLYSGVRGVTDLMMMPGLINLDFADIRAVMAEMGKAMMGTGEAQGDRRALDAAEAAISNPLLDDVSMSGARGVLINITGGYDMTLYEVDEAANRIRDEVDPEANIIFGSTFDEKLNGTIRVSVVATGIGGLLEAAKQQKTTATTSARPESTAADFAPRDFGFPVTTGMPQKTVAEGPTLASSQQSQGGVMHAASADAETKTAAVTEPVTVSDFSPTSTTSFPGVSSADQHQTATPAPTLRESEEEMPQERRRHTSLFERFTGVSRGSKSTQQAAAKNQASVISTPESDAETADIDELEIPAFLRRNNH